MPTNAKQPGYLDRSAVKRANLSQRIEICFTRAGNSLPALEFIHLHWAPEATFKRALQLMRLYWAPEAPMEH